MRAVAVLLFVLAGLAITTFKPTLVAAHPFLVGSEPVAGSVAPASLNEVRLTFSERVEVAPDRLTVLDRQGRRVDLRDARRTGGDGTVVSVSLGPLSNGVYTVSYALLSDDNHTVRGSFRFGIGVPLATVAGEPAVSTPGALSPLTMFDAVARWLNLLGLALLIGPAVVRLLLGGRRAEDVAGMASLRATYAGRQLLWARIAVTILLAAQVLGLAAISASLSTGGVREALSPGSLGATLVSRFGALWLARVGTILLALVLVDWLGRVQTACGEPGPDVARNDTRHVWSTLLGLSMILVLFTSLGGHAATTPPVALSVAIDALHVAAAAIWVGGLLALTLFLPGLVRAAGIGASATFLATTAPRFSSVAFWSVELLVVTGLYQTWTRVGQPAELGTTAYGQALITKLVLLVPLLALAAVNRYITLPRIRWYTEKKAAAPDTASNPLRATRLLLLSEAGLAVLVLLVVGVLTALPPARGARAATAGSPDASPATATGVTLADHAGPTLVTLTIGPTTSGPALIAARLQDIGGQPVVDGVVRLRATRDGDPAQFDIILQPRGGQFVGKLDLSAAGVWRLAVSVTPRDGPPGGATFSLTLPTGSARVLLAQADAAMNQLRSARERQTLWTANDPAVIDYRYQAPDRVVIRMPDGGETIGIGERRFVLDPGGQWTEEPWPDTGGFRWPAYNYAATATDVVLLGVEDRAGVRCWVVAFATPDNGARYTVWIGAADSLLRAVRMTAPGHYMDATLSEFDAPGTITAPVP